MTFLPVLITANREVAAPFFEETEALRNQLAHLPLEHYTYTVDREESRLAEQSLDRYSFIVHGNLRNARFFIKWVWETGVMEVVRERVHLVADRPASEFLEENGIPAVMPRINAKPIDIIEFMLRISREGNTLYPTTEQKTEELPGLLNELDMPVDEFTVCREVSIPPDTLNSYRKKLKQMDIKGVLFHNRSSVVRIQNAFPDLDLGSLSCIAASAGVAQKMKEEGIRIDEQASGSWASVLKLLGE